MNRRFSCIFLAAISSCILTQVLGLCETYKGAVVEYHPVVGPKDESTMLKNAENYGNFMEQAKKKGAEIIVFPEQGLFGNVPSPIPDPADQIVPCESPTFQTTEVLKYLSAASKKHKIYSVVNLLEKRECAADDKDCLPTGHYILNSNVVFDRTGKVIARYAKYNLFGTDISNRTKDPEIVFFDTDFGVRFGTFICFDILFPTPAQRLVQQYQITDFVFSTFWFSELPFLSALQAQRGWAETNNVNLLASGVNYPLLGSAGSGIYNGKYGQIVQIMPETSTSKLLIADIPKFKDRSCSNIYQQKTFNFSVVNQNFNNSVYLPAADFQQEKEENDSGILFLHDNLKFYASEVVDTSKIFETRICSRENFCCDFYINVKSLLPDLKNYTYRAVVYNGIREFGEKFRGGVQVCGVLACNGPEIINCTSRVKNISGLYDFKELRITGNFKLRNSFQMPSTLTDGEEVKPLSSNKYEFTKTEKSKSLEVTLELLWSVTDLRTFAIWGRDFSRDMEPRGPESSASIIVSLPILFGTFFAFILFLR